MIYVIGLGRDPQDLTQHAQNQLKSGAFTVLKTAKSRAGKAVRADLILDELFEQAADFDTLNEQIVQMLLRLHQEKGRVLYLVDGSGYTDSSVLRLRAAYPPVTIIAGVSHQYREPAGSLISLSAYDLLILPYLDTAMPVGIHALDHALIAGEVKLFLLEFYTPDQTIVFSIGDKAYPIALEALDRQKQYDYSASVYIPADSGLDKSIYTFADLLRLMRRLTAPDGCAWDKAQTHESILPNMLEEAYEAVDAVQSGVTEDICEELGDVLLQSVLHCDIAARQDEFTMTDCISKLCRKLYNRHPHVFGTHAAPDAGSAYKEWNNAKKEEKRYTSLKDEIERIPAAFPAFIKTQKILQKLTKAGCAPSAEEALRAMQRTIAEERDSSRLVEDLLMPLCIYASANGVDLEVALTGAASAYFRTGRKSVLPAQDTKE